MRGKALIAAGLSALLLGAVACASATAADPAPVTAKAGEVQVSYGEWSDPARAGRKVPYQLYLPAGSGPFPVVVHSHGLGGSREASPYIAQAVAQAGIAVFVIQHAGSDSGILTRETLAATRRGSLKLAPDAAEQRFRDLPFALDQITAMNGAGPLKGRLNLSRIGMSGHSFGALSTLVAVGQSLPGVGQALKEPRLRAAIVYSPNKPRQGDAATVFARMDRPIMHFTGTKDVSPVDLEKTPWERTIPFQTISGPDQYLIVLHDGDHGVFGGRLAGGGLNRPTDAAHVKVIVGETVRYWRAWLLDDAGANAELCQIPARVAAVADGYAKADHCGAPTPLPQ